MNTAIKLITIGIASLTIGLTAPASAQQIPTIVQATSQLNDQEALEVIAARCAALFVVMGKWMEVTAASKGDNQYLQLASEFERKSEALYKVNLTVKAQRLPGNTQVDIQKSVIERIQYLVKLYSDASADLYQTSGQTLTNTMKADADYCTATTQGM